MPFLNPAIGTGRRSRQTAIRKATGALALELGDRSPVQTILNAYDRATPTELQAGLGWYSVGHELALELGGAIRGAGIIAALSPQTSWVRNIELAIALHEGNELGPDVLPLSVDRATAIARGADPYFVLGGRKVRSFYANLLRPDHFGPVTVDRHAIGLLAGYNTERHAKLLERPGTYQTAASYYRAAARHLGILPNQVQAVVWLVHRRELDEIDARNRFQRQNPVTDNF